MNAIVQDAASQLEAAARAARAAAGQVARAPRPVKDLALRTAAAALQMAVPAGQVPALKVSLTKAFARRRGSPKSSVPKRSLIA